MSKRLVIAACAAALAGCAQYPQSAEEFRSEIRGSTFSSVESFTVPTPFSRVAKTYREMADRCLNLAIKVIKTERTPIGNTRMMVEREIDTGKRVYFRPTVFAKPDHFELHVQRQPSDNSSWANYPAGGEYILVVDARPADRKNTRITLYRTRLSHIELRSAVRDWSVGHGRRCPTLK